MSLCRPLLSLPDISLSPPAESAGRQPGTQELHCHEPLPWQSGEMGPGLRSTGIGCDVFKCL